MLAGSFDVVEALRSLATEVESLQRIVAGLEARVQVLEAEAKVEVDSPATVAPRERIVGKQG
jgi:hypothetical protein